jgi:DNA-binding NtrC family response regulator
MDSQVLVISSLEDTLLKAKEVLRPMGYDLIHKQRLASGLRAMKGEELVILDVPEGVRALKEIRSYHPGAVVLLVDGEECHKNAIEEGAFDCLQRPPDPWRLKVSARNAINHIRLKGELDRRAGGETPHLTLGGNVRMSKVLRNVQRLSSKDTHVLIMGEQGTGKELVAKAIHMGSFRRSGAFVPVPASGEGFMSLLFGGASAPGVLASAEGGTVFIRDPGGVEGPNGEKFRRFLSERRFVPEGPGSKPVRADVRVICAVNGTGVDPRLPGWFASALKLPSLRERPEDIVPLAEQFLAESAELFGTGPRKLTKEAARALLKYRWPGNVGELKNTMRKACLLAQDTPVNIRHLAMKDGEPYYSVKEFLEVKLKRYIKDMTKLGNTGLYGTVMSEVEKALIELVIKETGGNQLKAAAALGINRTTLRTKINNYRIKSPRA